MYRLYLKTDICVIPTLYSEGTSLSAIESMAAGCAIVATRIGGLTDIIIDGYNGLLVNPCAIDVKNAISMLIENKKKREELQKNAKLVSSALDKKIWDDKWWKVIREFIDEGYSQKANYKICNIIVEDDLDIVLI